MILLLFFFKKNRIIIYILNSCFNYIYVYIYIYICKTYYLNLLLPMISVYLVFVFEFSRIYKAIINTNEA